MSKTPLLDELPDTGRKLVSAYWLEQLAPCPYCASRGIRPSCSECNGTGYAKFETAEDYISEVVSQVEAERMAAWKKFEICAAARETQGGNIMGTLAETLNVGKRQVRNYVALGRTFPPESRSYVHDAKLYLEALKADDPVAAVAHAIDSGYSPKELKDWLKGGDEQGKNVELTEWRELLHIDESATVEIGVWFLRIRQQIVNALQQASLMNLILDDVCELKIKVQIAGLFEKETEKINNE